MFFFSSFIHSLEFERGNGIGGKCLIAKYFNKQKITTFFNETDRDEIKQIDVHPCFKDVKLEFYNRRFIEWIMSNQT